MPQRGSCVARSLIRSPRHGPSLRSSRTRTPRLGREPQRPKDPPDPSRDAHAGVRPFHARRAGHTSVATSTADTDARSPCEVMTCTDPKRSLSLSACTCARVSPASARASAIRARGSVSAPAGVVDHCGASNSPQCVDKRSHHFRPGRNARSISSWPALLGYAILYFASAQGQALKDSPDIPPGRAPPDRIGRRPKCCGVSVDLPAGVKAPADRSGAVAPLRRACPRRAAPLGACAGG